MIGSYLSAASAVVKSNFRRLGRPYKLTLALTYRCNFHCRACRTWRRAPGEEMSLEELEEFFRRQNCFSWIDLTGGEISLREDLPEVMRAVAGLSRRLVLLHFPTNGYLTGRILEAVRAVKKRPGRKFVVTISLDGPPEVHDRLKGMTGSWERALETFAALRRERGVEVFLGMTLQKENLSLRRETIAAVQGRVPGFVPAELHYNLAQSSFFYDNLDQDPSPGREALAVLDEITPGRRLVPGPRRFLERSYLLPARRFIRDGLCPLPCQALSASCFIEPEGIVYPCTGYDLPLGNLRDSGYDLAPLWNAPRAVALREEIVRGICPHCWTPCEAYQTILGNLFRRFLPGAEGRLARRYAPRHTKD